MTLSYQEVKALATGNPVLLDQAKAEPGLVRLERIERTQPCASRCPRRSRRTTPRSRDAGCRPRFPIALAEDGALIPRRLSAGRQGVRAILHVGCHGPNTAASRHRLSSG